MRGGRRLDSGGLERRKLGRKRRSREMVDDREAGEAGVPEWRRGAPGGGKRRRRRRRRGKKEVEEEEVEEEYAAARKSRPIFQRGTIATERPGDHLKYLVAGRKLSGTGSR